MSLLETFVSDPDQMEQSFLKIRNGGIPDTFDKHHLINLGFDVTKSVLYSSLFISLGLVDMSANPTADFERFVRSDQDARRVIREKLWVGYKNIFALDSQAHHKSVDQIIEIFRSVHGENKSLTFLRLLAQSFKSLTDFADWSPVSHTNGIHNSTNGSAANAESASNGEPTITISRNVQASVDTIEDQPESKEADMKDTESDDAGFEVAETDDTATGKDVEEAHMDAAESDQPGVEKAEVKAAEAEDAERIDTEVKAADADNAEINDTEVKAADSESKPASRARLFAHYLDSKQELDQKNSGQTIISRRNNGLDSGNHKQNADDSKSEESQQKTVKAEPVKVTEDMVNGKSHSEAAAETHHEKAESHHENGVRAGAESAAVHHNNGEQHPAVSGGSPVVTALMKRTELLEKMNRDQEAIEALDQILSYFEKYGQNGSEEIQANTLMRKAEILEKTCQYEQALHVYDAYLLLNQNSRGNSDMASA